MQSGGLVVQWRDEPESIDLNILMDGSLIRRQAVE